RCVRPRMGGQIRRVAAKRGRPGLRRFVDGTRRRTGPVRELDCAPRARRRQQAGGLCLRAVWLRRETPARHAMTMHTQTVEVIRQHLIDPEICIRCNTCEETCPVDAVTHDARNYVVDVTKCNGCNECIAPCPTGAI